MINLESHFNDITEDPFPYVYIENFFQADFLKKLNDNFPEMPRKHSEMFGRKKIPNFKNKDLSEDWKKLNIFLESSEFHMKLFKSFKEYYFNDVKIDFNKRVRIINSNQYNSKIEYNGYNDFCVYYDISEASTGYFREVHRDTDKRFINFLIYLNSPKISGGELVLYSSSKETKHKRQYPINVSRSKIVPPIGNTALFFLSNRHSYHSVNVISECQTPRKFIYGSITSHNKSGVWK